MTSGGRIAGLDALRGVACLLVVLSHADVPGFRFAGQTGVTLFLALSGYLITSILLEERSRTGRVRVRAFYWRRAIRLLPALFLLIAVDAALFGLGERAWIAATYLGNWARLWGADMGSLVHVWSLAIEEQFYLVWPFVVVVSAALAPRRMALVLLGLALVPVVLRAVIADPIHVQVGTETRADALLVGAALAYVPVRVGWKVGLCALAALLLAGITVHPAGYTLAAIASVLLVGWSRDWPTIRPLAFVGTVSYGLYLWHVWLLDAYRQAIDQLPVPAKLLVVGGLGLILASLSYYLVERPIRLHLRDAQVGGHIVRRAAGAGLDSSRPR